AFFSRSFGRLLKQGAERPSLAAFASRAAGRVAVYIAGAAIPFLLWMAYLYLCFAGIKDLKISGGYPSPLLATPCFPAWVRGQPPFRNPNRMVLSGNRHRTIPPFSLARTQRKFPPPSLS